MVGTMQLAKGLAVVIFLAFGVVSATCQQTLKELTPQLGAKYTFTPKEYKDVATTEIAFNGEGCL